MPFAAPLTSLATLAALLLMFLTALGVGRARGKYSIAAPAVTGHPMFERTYRVQMNTLEGAVLFLPALWLAVPTLGDLAAAAVGMLWVFGRAWYALAYVREPKSRGKGFLIGVVSWAILMVAALVGAFRAMVGGAG